MTADPAGITFWSQHMPVTVLVEPDPGGHRFQSVAWVAERAARLGRVVLLTSAGAREGDAFAAYLHGVPLEVREPFDHIYPPTRQIAHEVAELCRTEDVGRVLVMDADQSLKRWWFDAAAEFRGLGRRRPKVLFMLTRYPASIAVADWFGWSLRVSKASLVLLAKATGTLHRVSGFAGRADMSRGWVVKRARDPEVCTAHSRDRAAIRADLRLPADAVLVGLFGVISTRKMAPFILAATMRSGSGGLVLLGGKLDPEVRAWVDALPPAERERLIVRDEYLSNADIDRAVAAVDVVAIALTNNGPSGFMGKALAAGVPVVTAGSRVRAQEAIGTGSGEIAELEVGSFGAAIDRALRRDMSVRPKAVPPATSVAYAECLLGLEPDDAPVRSPA